MQDNIFVDSNILLYSLSTGIKSEIANNILINNKCNISSQNISEVSNILLKKIKLSTTDLKIVLRDILRVTNYNLITYKVQADAINIKEQYQFSYYDSLIIASALEANCNILYSEDMQNNQIIYNRLKIINPFL